MKKIIFICCGIFIFSSFAIGQKGVDSQTQKIKEQGSKITDKGNDVNRTFDWGKGKTKVRERLPNPYRLNSRRDVLTETIIEVLKEKKIVVDESSSRLNDGIIITQPFVFAKGPVTSKNELNRYAVLPGLSSVWTSGRYTLTIEVQSIDGIQNNVAVNAKVEGRSENAFLSEWTTLQSSGAAEEEFLKQLVELVTGKALDEPQEIDQ